MRLKDAAAAADVLVMGPDCGTAVVGGVALGFANVVRPGSGRHRRGLRHRRPAGHVPARRRRGRAEPLPRCRRAATCRRPSAGRSTRQALAALADDPATETVARGLQAAGTPRCSPTSRRMPPSWACRCTGRRSGAGRPDLTAAVEAFLAGRGPRPVPTWPVTRSRRRSDRGRWPSAPARLRGLFCGGTLADEAMLVAGGELGGIRCNIPLAPELALGADLRDPGHVVIDFGDDGLTRGRAHPMIDPTLRLERIAARGRRPHAAACCCSTSCSATAPTPTRPPSSRTPCGRPARPPRADGRDAAGRRLADRHRRRPAGLERAAPSRSPTAGASVLLSNAAATRHALAPAREPRDRRRPADPPATDPCAACSRPTRSSRPPGSRCSPTRCAHQAVPVTETAVAAADGRHRRPTSPASWRDPRRAAANALALRADDRRRRRPRRRAAGPRGAGPRARHLPARRAAARVGAGLRADARRPHRRDALRGPGRHRRGRRGRASPQATVRRSSRATTATPSARWPASSARRCGSTSCATTCTATRRGARSTRASARCCATAPTVPR